MQVLVPNSETFEKPFTNWTYDDTIIRTVIALKVAREDDPVHVRHIIFSVLHQIPAVLGDPAPQVFLLDMDDTLLEFEVRYFINMQQGRSRTEIRSEVLFSLFETFKEQGLHTPIPQQDVYVRHLPQPT
jgi:potassium efflux system protein